MSIHRAPVDLEELSPLDLVIAFASAENEKANLPELGGIIRLISKSNKANAWAVHYHAGGGAILTGHISLGAQHSVYYISHSAQEFIGRK